MGSEMSRLQVVAAAVLLAIAILPAANARAEQQAPPIHGVTGTVATEESRKDTKEAGRGIMSRVAGLFGLGRKDAISDAAAEEIFATLKSGTRITIRTAPEEGKPAPQEVEAVIMSTNPAERTLSIRLEDGTRQTLRLADAGSANERDAVVVAVMGQAGEPTPYYFKRLP